MRHDDEAAFYLGAGPLLALGLGFALTPLRGLTTASNLAFPFIVLTIVVAELGGRWAAMATAVTAALSLDFFLTQPYLRLTIHGRDDVIAFVELAVCGLVAAAFRSQRARTAAALTRADQELGLVHDLLADLDDATRLEPQLDRVLQASRQVLPLAGATLRDARGYLLATADPDDGLRPIPETVLEGDARLPEEGARIPITVGSRRLGWLDVWGNGSPAGADARRLLGHLIRLVAIRLTAADGGIAARG